MSGASEREKFVRCVKCGKETCQTTDWSPPCKECGELQHKYVCDMPPKPVETGMSGASERPICQKCGQPMYAHRSVKGTKWRCVHCMASGLPTPVRDAEIERLRADSRRHLQQLESAEAALIKAGIKMGDRQGALVSVTEGIEELAAELQASQDHAESLSMMYDKMREDRNDYFHKSRTYKEENESLQSKLAELRACLVEPGPESDDFFPVSIRGLLEILVVGTKVKAPVWAEAQLKRINKAVEE